MSNSEKLKKFLIEEMIPNLEEAIDEMFLVIEKAKKRASVVDKEFLQNLQEIHADDITFICGDEDFLKFQFDGKSIEEVTTSYYKCIANSSPHCKPFPWERFGVDLNYYLTSFKTQ